jgi:hypothetical protein
MNVHSGKGTWGVRAKGESGSRGTATRRLNNSDYTRCDSLSGSACVSPKLTYRWRLPAFLRPNHRFLCRVTCIDPDMAVRECFALADVPFLHLAIVGLRQGDPTAYPCRGDTSDSASFHRSLGNLAECQRQIVWWCPLGAVIAIPMVARMLTQR